MNAVHAIIGSILEDKVIQSLYGRIKGNEEKCSIPELVALDEESFERQCLLVANRKCQPLSLDSPPSASPALARPHYVQPFSTCQTELAGADLSHDFLEERLFVAYVHAVFPRRPS